MRDTDRAGWRSAGAWTRRRRPRWTRGSGQCSRTRVSTIVLDLAALDYLSSAGIRCIFRARKALEGRGGRVVILRPQPAVQKVLDIVRALPSVQIFACTTELDRYLDAMQRRARGDQP